MAAVLVFVRRAIQSVNEVRPALRGPLEHKELLGLSHGKQLKHRRVNQAEDRCVCPNAKSESEDGDCGESRVAAKLAEAVAQILKQGFEPLEAPGRAHVFFDL